MEDPIKVIHKYKNNNKRYQYHIYIFIGNIIDNASMNVLNKIKDLDFYKTLLSLSEKERGLMVKNYGEYWYEKFFNSRHIIHTFETLTKGKLQEIEKIYSLQWVEEHVHKYQKRLEIATYSYEAKIKIEKDRKNIKKVIQEKKEKIGENINYSLSDQNQYVLSRPSADQYQLRGREGIPYQIVQRESCEEDNSQEGGNNPTIDIINADPSLDLEWDEKNENFDKIVDADLADYDLIFQETEEADHNIKLTTKEIREAISKENYESINKKILEFDTSKDNQMSDENLKDVYHKYYVTHQYIFKDDTIKNISNKICCGFKNNKKFGDNNFILPSFQYLWSEYLFEGKISKIMIGKKLLIKNNIIKLDIEPNHNLNIYEELTGVLKLLKNNIRRHGKIRFEDDDYNILYDYDRFYTMNEIFLLDIYNELGLDYHPSAEELENLIDVYIKIYFPRLREEIKNILKNLKSENVDKNEESRMKLVYDSINTSLIMENEVMHDVEYAKKYDKREYLKIFKENYVNQCIIRTYLDNDYKKIDLYRIFDNFELSDIYPFIQYQNVDGIPKIRYNKKYFQENDKRDIITKWFENTPYAISFKIKILEKEKYRFISVNLNDTGRIDYKIHWKEEDMYKISNVKNTYLYIIDLIKKINSENKKQYINLKIPDDSQFKFAYINTIQKFELPENFVINHNDLSEFAIYFFPYVSLVIEPRKRVSKKLKRDTDKSKYGTYLRYKRVSKYENKTKIEHRIIFFMRNYEYDFHSLTLEISKEFNITEEQAQGEINAVLEKYPNIKHSRRVLKKLENIPKCSLSGVGIAIQGKDRDKYKIKIEGARSEDQLERINLFMNILIYLYIETYLYKREDRQKMKDTLKKITKIARRRNKVEELNKEIVMPKTIKQMTSIDKKRLGYKAEEDQNQWARTCQKSGDDKLRQPQYYLNEEDLMNNGYVWKDTLEEYPYGHYEKKIILENQKGKESVIYLKAAKLTRLDDEDNGENYVYYTCDPEKNGKHMYIGFLDKSKNPYDEAMPCCFIKDQLYSKNIEKRNKYLRNMGVILETKDVNKISGDQLYILQDSNKIHEGRFAFLPKYLDIFLNMLQNHTYEINNHYLLSSATGYYFKYGSNQTKYKFLNSIAVLFDLDVTQMKEKMLQVLQRDRDLRIFTSLNNGDIRLRFGEIENYMRFISEDEYLDYHDITDLLSIPHVISPGGLHLVIFQKKEIVIKKNLEKEQVDENYYIICQNYENTDQIKNPERDIIILIKQHKNYYPIVSVSKQHKDSKQVDIVKRYHYQEDQKNIVYHILEYYNVNCHLNTNLIHRYDDSGVYLAKETFDILSSMGKGEYLPVKQIIDARFKCRYLLTKGGYLIPVIPSGSLYHLPIGTSVSTYALDYDTTKRYLEKLSNESSKFKLKIVTLYYFKKEGNQYWINAVMTESHHPIPILNHQMTLEKIKEEKYLLQSKIREDEIDRAIAEGPQKNRPDDRIYQVAKHKYITELYQLFRLHLSYYLNTIPGGSKSKEKLEAIIYNKKIANKEKRLKIKSLLYKISSPELYKIFSNLIKNIDNTEISSEYKEGKIAKPKKEKEGSWLSLQGDNFKLDYNNFRISNNREICYECQKKEDCTPYYHCQWNPYRNLCLFSVKKIQLVDYINKVTEEFIQNEIKAQEILQKGVHFVSDIVDRNIFKERPGERVIISTNINTPKILSEIFGKNEIPNIGKKKLQIDIPQNYLKLNMEHPLRELDNWHVQEIININVYFRAFANGYYWLLHPYNDISYRNLGYYSELQTLLSNFYKSELIDWLLENEDSLGEFVPRHPIKVQEYIARINEVVKIATPGLFELCGLTILYQVHLFVYNDNYQTLWIFDPDRGLIYDHRNPQDINLLPYEKMQRVIHLKMSFLKGELYADKIETLYPRIVNV